MIWDIPVHFLWLFINLDLPEVTERKITVTFLLLPEIMISFTPLLPEIRKIFSHFIAICFIQQF